MVQQCPGVNREVISWVDEVWREMNASTYTRTGGLLCDEMTIQVCYAIEKR